jgi:hypothetical protein
MAFGLLGAPATFLEAMNLTLGPLLRKSVLVFFDDILIFSHCYEQHVQHVRQVLELLQRDKWQVKMSKCVFAQCQLKYLGHAISADGVATDLTKVQAVLDWPTPTSVCIAYMVCRQLSFLRGTRYSQANFGKSCLPWPRSSCT